MIKSDSNPILTEEKINLELNEKNKLTFKQLLKLSNKFVVNKKIGIIICMILLSLSLFVFGLAIIMFSNFNFGKITNNTLVENNSSFIDVSKGYIDNKSGKLVYVARQLNDEDENMILDGYSDTDYDYTYNLFGHSFYNGSTGNQFLKGSTQYAIVSNQEGLKKRNYAIEYGVYPTNFDEVAITDYMLLSLYYLKPQLINEKLGITSIKNISDSELINAIMSLDLNTYNCLFGQSSEINTDMLNAIKENPGLILLNSTIDLVTASYKISGIVKTDYKDYVDLMFDDDLALNNDDRTDFYSYNVNNYYYNLFVNESFIDHLYLNSNSMFLGNITVGKFDMYKTYLSIDDTNLEDGEIMISSSYFREYFKEEFNIHNKDKYILNLSLKHVLGKDMTPDVIISNDFKVVGVFDLPIDYQENLYYSRVVLTNDEEFNDLASELKVLRFISLSTKNIDVTNYINTLYENRYVYFTNFSFSMYQLNDTMNLYKKIFIIVSIIVLLISTIFVSFFFNNIVGKRKKDIGILRALGIEKKQIYFIFSIGGLIISLFTLVLSILLLIIGKNVVDNILSHGFILLLDTDGLDNLKILFLEPLVFVAIFVVCFIIPIISLILPIRKISINNPIKTLKSQE